MDTLTTTLSTLIYSTTEISLDAFRSQMLWALIVGTILAFVLGFAMGGNDVANAFGTSVGSKVLSLKQAYLLAVIFETLGALLVGYNVTDTMRKMVINVDEYNNTPNELMLGQVAILGGCSTWLLIATVARMPVSTTHSIVGATLGFGIFMRGNKGIHWEKVIQIVFSWFVSPLFSGIVSGILYIIVDFSVLRRKNPYRSGLTNLPIFYFFCIAFNVFVISYQGSKLLHLAKLPLWFCLVLSLVIATIGSLLIFFIMVPRLKIWIDKSNPPAVVAFQTSTVSPKSGPFVITCNFDDGVNSAENHVNKSEQDSQATHPSHSKNTILSSIAKGIKTFIKWFLPARDRETDARTLKIFGSIQAFTACFAGFAHGANDVSNSIAPYTAMLSIYLTMSTTQSEETPIYILLYGVLAICVGLVCLGHRVIRTVGTNMSKINAASGFTIEFGAAITALLASKLGLPISTTHALVGSVVAVGIIKSREGIRWKIFRDIVLSWVITLPVSGIIAAAIMFFLNFTL